MNRSSISTVTLFCGLLIVLGGEGTAAAGTASDRQPPHIILIIADDLGWNDVGFHGSDEIPTPNIDALAYNGVILNNYYSQSLCTPSRAALLTGKYPIHTGMQHTALDGAQPWGLGLNERLLPEILNDVGYSSHAVGKWHLGFFKREYTPTLRGFASHFGFWQGYQDYYNHTSTFESYTGYDMRRDLNVAWDAWGHYSTDLFTREAVTVISQHDSRRCPLFLYLSHQAPHSGGTMKPYQAPDDAVAKFRYIDDPRRRVYAAMVSKLDDSVGEVVAALRAKNMLDNSVVIFISDNGSPAEDGPHSFRGSNYPLRGGKNSAWEGGNRVVAAIWSPLIEKLGRVSNELMHVTDWLPSLYTLTGRNLSDLKNIDGINVWNTLSRDRPSQRKQMVYNIDEEVPYGAVREGAWKYVAGSATGLKNLGWYGQKGRNLTVKYNTQAVLNSKVEVAISSYWTMKKLDALTRQQSSNMFPQTLTPSKISTLRQKADVKCSVRASAAIVECRPLESPCLFNLKEDPCERVNLADSREDIVQRLEDILEMFQKSLIPPRNKPSDYKAADPGRWNGGVWTPWADDDMVDMSIGGFNAADYLVEIVVGSVLTATCLLIVAFSAGSCRSRYKVTSEIQ